MAADYHVITDDGFQQFTLCSFQRFRWKLRNARMNLAMAVRANQYAMLDLCLYPFPGTSDTVLRDAERLFLWILVMDVESVDAPVVSADLTLAAEKLDGLHPDPLSTLADCALDRFGSLGVGSLVGHTN
ncbi:MAG: hypothetical protein WCO25_00105 [Candidatus Uhrbacteria bacterium]